MNKPTTLSFWERESFFKNIDIAIIGSGIVGLNAALSLKEKNKQLRIAIFEKGILPEGASTRNAGFACFGSITELLDDLKTRSEDEVLALVERRFAGLQKLRQRVGDANMDYEGNGGYEIFKKDDNTVTQNVSGFQLDGAAPMAQNALKGGDSLSTCLEHLSYFNKNVGKITGLAETYKISNHNFGFQNTDSTLIHNTAEGQINTGKTIVSLLNLCKEQNISIFNGISIKEIHDSSQGVTLITEDGWEIPASKLIVATNGFARRLMPELEVTPARNQVLITQPIDNLKIKGCFHYDKGYFYFRNVGNRILFGGGRNLDFDNEMTDTFGTTSLIQNALIELLDTVILPHQKYQIDTWWSGILGIGSQKMPIIKAVSPNVIVAVRMGGMGVAIGSLVGEEAAEMVI